MASLEETCIFAAIVYIEMILLHIPGQEVHASTVNTKLQRALRTLDYARERVENNDVVMWISATGTAALSVGVGQSRTSSLIDKFNTALEHLERLSITGREFGVGFRYWGEMEKGANVFIILKQLCRGP
jgi:hypothetical protein